MANMILTRDKNWIGKPSGATINRGHPLSKGLVGCWLMNEGSGNRVIDIASGNNGVITNGNQWKNTVKGRSINFSDATKVINCTTKDVLFDTYSPCSTRAIIYPTSLISIDRIVGKGDPTSTRYILMGVGSAGVLLFTAMGSTPLRRDSANGSIVVNKWYDCVVTWGGTIIATTVHLYINGKETSYGTTTNGSGLSSSSGDLTSIGGRSDGTRGFTGNISTVQVWDRVLSPHEVHELYGSPYQFILSKTKTYFLPVGAPAGPTNVTISANIITGHIVPQAPTVAITTGVVSVTVTPAVISSNILIQSPVVIISKAVSLDVIRTYIKVNSPAIVVSIVIDTNIQTSQMTIQYTSVIISHAEELSTVTSRLSQFAPTISIGTGDRIISDIRIIKASRVHRIINL